MEPTKVSIPKIIQKSSKPKKANKKVDNDSPFFYPAIYFSTSRLGNMARMNEIMMSNKQLMINISTCYRSTRFFDDSKILSRKLKKAVALRRQNREGYLQRIVKENIKMMKRISGAESTYKQDVKSRIKSVASISGRNNDSVIEKWSILPEGELSDPTKRITCFFDITIDKIKRGRLLFEIYCDIVPETAENFIALCESEFYPTYRKTTMHQVFSGFFCLGGEVNNFSAKKNKRRGYFPDENHNLEHAGPGVISMFNSEPDKNGTQFLITFKKFETLNGRFVVFGRLKNKKSLHVLEMIEEFGTKSGIPKKQIVISDCGVL